MTGSAYRAGLAADALATAAAAALGLLLLWCGFRMLPDAAQAGFVLFSPDPLSEGPLSGTALTQLVGFCAAAAGLLLTLWWVLGFGCALAGCLLHRFGFRKAGSRTLSLAPVPLRRLASAALGASLAAGTLWMVPGAAATEAAAPAPPAPAPAFPFSGIPRGPGASETDPRAPESADAAEVISPLWRPSAPQPPAGGLLTGVPRQDEREVVVAAGDTLWSLAASHLGSQATDAETAAH